VIFTIESNIAVIPKKAAISMIKTKKYLNALLADCNVNLYPIVSNPSLTTILIMRMARQIKIISITKEIIDATITFGVIIDIGIISFVMLIIHSRFI